MIAFIVACLAAVVAVVSHFWIKKLGLTSKEHAERAEEAARRTEEAAQRISEALNHSPRDRRP